MEHDNTKTCVYFDSAYPRFVKDRNSYIHFAVKTGRDAKWLDITYKEDKLIALGINPKKAVKELYISIESSDQGIQI